jgi:predicted DNA binding CopG/RHH family protein
MCLGAWTGGDPSKHKSQTGQTGVGYSSVTALKPFEALVYAAAKDYMRYHNVNQNIRHYFPKSTIRLAVAKTLLWRCEKKMAAKGFHYQQFVNRPLSSNLSRYEIQKLVAKQNELGRELSKQDIGRVLNPYRYKDPDDFSVKKPRKKRKKKKS